jgi:hypothetical protein
LLHYHYARTIKQNHHFAREKHLGRLWREFDALTFFNKVMDLFFKLLIFFRRSGSRHGTGEALVGDLEDHGRKRTDGDLQLHDHKLAHAFYYLGAV